MGTGTLIDAIRFFSDEQRCFEFARDVRWPDGVCCPACQGERLGFIRTRKLWKCRDCYKQFSVRAGTFMEGSQLPLDKWFVAQWMLANARNGVSSYELARTIGVTQKTAWYMLHRIRCAMAVAEPPKLTGEIEVDETYIGGKFRFMHHRRKMGIKGRGTIGKIIVMGFLQRGGSVQCQIIPNITKGTLCSLVKQHVEPGSTVYSDALGSYESMDSAFTHHSVDHSRKQFVSGNNYTNGIENFWCLLKRAIKGTYTWVSEKHLRGYLDEAIFRFNHRGRADGDRFRLISSCVLRTCT